MANVLNNAVKFTPRDGKVKVVLKRVNSQIEVTVSDTGLGIDPEFLPHVFERFSQADASSTRKHRGLGLGLAIVKNLVELHGGTIDANSEGRGKGATFRVRLPLRAPVSEGTAAPSLPALDELCPSRQKPTTPKLSILLVEDHGDTARIMRQVLCSKGHHVQDAGDVATALRLAADHPFDLLLSDLGLPDGSGLDLMRTLRLRGLTLPGIALSGYGQEQDLKQSRAVGFTTHLVKPVKLSRLEEAIAQIAGE